MNMQNADKTNDINVHELRSTALRVNEHIIRMAGKGGCFIGASLSCTDLMVYLYKQFLKIDPYKPDDPNRDYFFLSKGHAVPALYGTLAEIGMMDSARFENHLKTNDDIYWHPNPKIAGVEFPSGSLGHLLPVAVGVAMDIKMSGQSNKVVVVTGDGELNEGSNWEACLIAAAKGLDNLVIVVDRNFFQANEQTENLIPIEPLEEKFFSFGCSSITLNGHDYEDLHTVFSRIPFRKGSPNVVIAETVRGNGVPSIEARADRWFYNITDETVEELLAELHNEHSDLLVPEVAAI